MAARRVSGRQIGEAPDARARGRRDACAACKRRPPDSPASCALTASPAASRSPATSATTSLARTSTGRSTGIPRRSRSPATPRTSAPRSAARGRSGSPITIRGGGHSIAGRSIRDGALCIDLRALNAVDVDPATGIVRVGGGALLERARRGDAGARARGAGRADLAHRRRRAGARRRPRLADAPPRADGRRAARGGGRARRRPDRAATPTSRELLWALRGGGGEFGVVTEFEFQAVPRRQPCSAGCSSTRGSGPARRSRPPLGDGRRAGRADHVRRADHGAAGARRGGRAAVIAVAWSGELAEGERVIAPLRAGARRTDLVGPMPYVALQSMLDHTAPRGLALPRQAALPARGRRRLRRRAARGLRARADARVPRDDRRGWAARSTASRRARPPSATAARAR